MQPGWLGFGAAPSPAAANRSLVPNDAWAHRRFFNLGRTAHLASVTLRADNHLDAIYLNGDQVLGALRNAYGADLVRSVDPNYFVARQNILAIPEGKDSPRPNWKSMSHRLEITYTAGVSFRLVVS